MLVEMRQFTAAACSRAIPPKARDLHASVAAVKGSARKPPGNILCREERHVRRPRATELAHLRAPATLAELIPRRAKSAICNCSSQLQYSRSLRYVTVRHANRACCDLPFFRRSVIGPGTSA
jgi:hypothetical protein